MLSGGLFQAMVGNSRIGNAVDEAYVPGPWALCEENLNDTELC
jgi:hypothetical protein